MREDSFRLPYKDEVPRWLRRLGCFDNSKDSMRFSWGAYSKPYRPYTLEISKKLGLALQVYQSEDGPHHFGLNIHLLWPGFYIPIPYIRTWKKYDEIFPSWGFSYFNDGWPSIHLNWGGKCKIIDFPFGSTFGFQETLLKDKTWYRHKRSPTLGKDFDFWKKEYKYLEENAYTEKHPYVYLLRSGEVQKTTATCKVERWVWYRRGLQWLGWPKKERMDIAVDFADEVGERSGSWKGGCTGCHWDMKPGDTIYMALKRMEQERKFK